MSIAVDLRELAERIAEYGPVAFLVTIGGAGPHVVSTHVAVDGDALVASAGRTTATNAEERPRVTVMWAPVPPRSDYCLLVDGDATLSAVDGGDGGGGGVSLRVVPDRAVLHRMVGAPGDGPGCVTVLDVR